jgi:hypothetical protein
MPNSQLFHAFNVGSTLGPASSLGKENGVSNAYITCYIYIKSNEINAFVLNPSPFPDVKAIR